MGTESSAASVISPPRFKHVSEREVHVLRTLVNSLPREPSPLPLTTLVRHCNMTAAEMRLYDIGVNLPVLPSDFLAIAMVHGAGRDRMAFVLTVDSAKRLVNRGLSRTHHGRASSASSASSDGPILSFFERGVMLEVAALVIEELGQCVVADLEIRGVLDSVEQLYLFLANNISDAEPKEPWHISGDLSLDGESGDCLLLGNGSLNFGTANTTAIPCRGDVAPFLSALPVAVHVVVGQTLLALASLDKLSIGDIVTVDALAWPMPLSTAVPIQKNEIQLYSGYVSRTATWLSPESIRLVEGYDMSERTETTQTMPAQPYEEAGDFEVPCKVEIDDLHITVAQAAALIPGQVLRLNRPLDEAVVLRAGGKRLCRGQLVQVGDELGIEVTEVL